MTRLQIFSDKWEQKHIVPDTYNINNDYANVITFMNMTSNETRTDRKQKKHKRQKN